jgi:phage shock protein PspC (stress-responsive transcriptional regulator)
MNEKKRFTRSENKLIAGVCGGIANYLDKDPTLIRVIYALLSLFTLFLGVVAYLVLWKVIPVEENRVDEL